MQQSAPWGGLRKRVAGLPPRVLTPNNGELSPHCSSRKLFDVSPVPQVAGIYFAFDLYNLSAGLDPASMQYQSFNAAPPSRNDPFYEPPLAPAPDVFQQPAQGAAAGPQL